MICRIRGGRHAGCKVASESQDLIRAGTIPSLFSLRVQSGLEGAENGCRERLARQLSQFCGEFICLRVFQIQCWQNSTLNG